MWSGQPGGCGNPASGAAYLTCYPPAVNYTPLYYLINGVAFNKTSAAGSLFPMTPGDVAPAAGTGSVLVRLVNAGLRMHVPSIVGSQAAGQTGARHLWSPVSSSSPRTAIRCPGFPGLQSDVFMAAGKTYDVMINGPAAGISAVRVMAGGSGYNLATTNVNLVGGGGTGAAVTPTFALTGVSTTSGGGGYAVGNTFTVAGTGPLASATVTVTSVDSPGTGVITGVTISTPGSFQIGSTSVAYNGPGAGTGAVLVPTFSLANIAIASAGSGYTSAPLITIVDSGGGVGASAVANVPALPVFDRELSLSGNAIERDAGMLAYIGGSGALEPSAAAFGAAVARADTYNALVAGQTLTVSDPSKGLLANDTNVYGVHVATALCSGSTPPATPTASCSPAAGTLSLNANGTFTYVPNAGTTSDWFVYQANGNGPFATVTLNASNIVDTAGVTCTATAYHASLGTYLAIKTPGVLSGCKDAANLPLTVNTATVTASGGLTVYADANGGFTASAPSAGPYSFSFQAKNSQGRLSTATTVTLNFPAGSGLTLNVLDGQDKTTPISDYRWIIEEDRTFYINPNCTANPPPAGCPTTSLGIVPTLGVNFHTSYMPYVAQGCTGPMSCEAGQMIVDPASGVHSPAVCDVGNGVCRPDPNQDYALEGKTRVLPGQVALDPSKRYYISILPGDAANPFTSGYTGGVARTEPPTLQAAILAATAWAALRSITMARRGRPRPGRLPARRLCKSSPNPRPTRRANFPCSSSKTTSRSMVSRMAVAASMWCRRTSRDWAASRFISGTPWAATATSPAR